MAMRAARRLVKRSITCVQQRAARNDILLSITVEIPNDVRPVQVSSAPPFVGSGPVSPRTMLIPSRVTFAAVACPRNVIAGGVVPQQMLDMESARIASSPLTMVFFFTAVTPRWI